MSITCLPEHGIVEGHNRGHGMGLRWMAKRYCWDSYGKKLYVNMWTADSKGGTWVFDINSNGTLSNMRKFTEWGGDGMSMDELGDIYISNGQGVMVFDHYGNNILTIPIGTAATNNRLYGPSCTCPGPPLMGTVFRRSSGLQLLHGSDDLLFCVLRLLHS